MRNKQATMTTPDGKTFPIKQQPLHLHHHTCLFSFWFDGCFSTTSKTKRKQTTQIEPPIKQQPPHLKKDRKERERERRTKATTKVRAVQPTNTGKVGLGLCWFGLGVWIIFIVVKMMKDESLAAANHGCGYFDEEVLLSISPFAPILPTCPYNGTTFTTELHFQFFYRKTYSPKLQGCFGFATYSATSSCKKYCFLANWSYKIMESTRLISESM
jgi:hypothetical protein